MDNNIIITEIQSDSIDKMVKLQEESIENGDLIIASSKDLFKRAFQFQNFVYGLINAKTNDLVGFCNCSIPTERSVKNLGQGIISDNDLNLVGHINTIIISKQIRRLGYGRKLISSVLSKFTVLQLQHIFTTISPSNASSIKLFKSFDFVEIGNKEYETSNRKVFYLLIK